MQGFRWAGVWGRAPRNCLEKFKLLIDSREQLPLKFRPGAFDERTVVGLPFGDYACEIGEDRVPICFERKGIGDLFGTMTQGYERFKKEMQRAKEANHKMILVIEKPLYEVEDGYRHSKYSGDSMLKKLAMLHVKYDLEYHFFNGRREMARFIEETFDAIRRFYVKEKRVGKRKASKESD